MKTFSKTTLSDKGENMGNRRLKAAIVLLVTLLAVMSFSLGAAAFMPQAAAANVGQTASAVVQPAASGAITAIPNSVSGLPTNGPTVMGQYTILPQNEVPAGSSPLPSTVAATVSLKPSQSLSAFINELNDPNNPEYRHFITISDIGSQFGSSSYAAVVNYFESYGLSVQASGGLLTLTVSGTPSQMAAAFHTTLTPFAREYNSKGVWNPLYGNESAVANSTTYAPGFYANTQPLAIPASISTAISGVAGLGGLIAQPMISAPINWGPGQNLTALAEAYNASHPGALQPTPYTGPSNPNVYSLNQIQGLAGANYTWTPGNQFSFECFFYGLCGATQTLYPSTMHALLGANNLWSGATTLSSEPDMGQGITIGLIEVGCLDLGTISSFSQQVWPTASQPGTPLVDRITQIGLNTPGSFFANNNYNGCLFNGAFNGWTLETALDVEYAATMAPMAHIDILASGSAQFSAFDTVYQDIAQYLSSGSTVLPTSVGTVVAKGATPTSTQDISQAAGSVSITSNSYGAGEEYVAFFGSPMYLTVENTLLEEMNAVGVTNFFASGDYSGAIYLAANQAGMPAISTGSTSVGGGMTTAESNGTIYPATNNVMCPSGYFAYNFDNYEGLGLGMQCMPNYFQGYPESFLVQLCFFSCVTPQYIAPATGLASFTYWSYGFGLTGTYQGAVGGGFGQSISEQQPWWQNALDSYSTGAAIDPVVSAEAAFNMTIYDQMFGGWFANYGGTSFATPTTAGEWALIEEQANVAYGTPKMGDINPILYAAHNANEAGVSSFSANPFVDMTAMGTGFDWGPINSFNWYYFNLSIEQPYDPVLPWWFNGLLNPAGNGWNYLQGLGMIQADVLDQELIGQTSQPGFSLTNPSFQVELVTSSGAVVPITGETLVGGQTYTLQVVTTNGQSGIFNVAAYSGGANDGTYGGGTVTNIQTGSNGQFTYTPTYTQPSNEVTNATEYGYFLITSVAGHEWSFADFAVAQPAASGTLSLCVLDPNGVCQTSMAEVTTFTTGYTGFYNLYPQGFVTLNGVPVANALITETSVNVSIFQSEDPTMPLSSYAPGAVLGTFVAGATGEFNFWSDAFTAELNGALPTQVVTLTATYDGLTSNVVTVFIEPQSGSYNTSNLGLNSAGTAITGTLTFSDMKDVNYVNISIGSSPGQYQNVTYPPTFYDSNNNVNVSGVFNGQIPVDLSTAGITGPIQVSLVAGGTNDLSFSLCFFGFCFEIQSVNLITWSDPIVFLPATISQSASTPSAVTGVDTISWAGTAYTGATSSLVLSSASGSSTTLSTALSGSYNLNTASLSDGWYTVTYTETAPGATTVKSISFYAENTQVALQGDINTLKSDLSAANSTIASLQSSLASANAQIASLQGQLATAQDTITSLQAQLSTDSATISQLNGEVSTLNSQLANDTSTITSLQSQVNTLNGQIATEQSQVSSLQSQVSQLSSQLSTSQSNNAQLTAEISSLNAQISTDKANIATLQTQVSTDNAQISSDSATISSLQAQVAKLQSELNHKSAYIAPAWYNTGYMPFVLLTLGVIFGALAGALIGRKQKTVITREGPTPMVPPSKKEEASTPVASATEGSIPPKMEQSIYKNPVSYKGTGTVVTADHKNDYIR